MDDKSFCFFCFPLKCGERMIWPGLILFNHIYVCLSASVNFTPFKYKVVIYIDIEYKLYIIDVSKFGFKCHDLEQNYGGLPPQKKLRLIYFFYGYHLLVTSNLLPV